MEIDLGLILLLFFITGIAVGTVLMVILALYYLAEEEK